MKTLRAYAVISNQDSHILYFTDCKDQLSKTDWLKENCYLKPIQLYNTAGQVSYKLFGLPYHVHSEDKIFYNLPGKFTIDVYHHKHFDHYNITKRLLEVLPHGSGINGNWNITYLMNGKIQATNFYSGMNEYGYYCHDADFICTIHINHLFQFTVERINLINGSREYQCCLYDIKSYLDELIAESLINERMNEDE